MSVTILLADDHPMIRHGLRGLLEGIPDFRIVGECNDGLEALQKIELTKPDILVIDLMMPNLNGLEVLRQVRKISPATQPIVFSMQSAEPYILEALEAGAKGYVLKDSGPGELVEAINTILAGEKYLSMQLAERFESNELQNSGNATEPYQTLTSREREILQMAAEGRSSTEIGKKLKISPRTVEVHRSHFMQKLGLKNQAELIRFAIKRGILPIDN